MVKSWNNKTPRWSKNKKKSGPKYLTGDFRKYNPKKYAGDLKKPIKFRSSYEYKFMCQLEQNPNVLWWKFENIIIPYKIKYGNVIKRHNYIMDFQVKFKTGDMFLCEVKPSNKSPKCEADLQKSDDHKRNAHKWKAAMSWCKINNHIFRIITEKHLKIKL